MVTTDVIQGAFRAIVESHVAGVSFYSVWSAIKDTESNTDFPACFWKATDTTANIIDSGAVRDSFIIDCLFLEQTASDRSSASRDMAYHRMNAIARQCWGRFVQLYVNATGTFEGVDLDFSAEQSTDARFLRIFDSGTMQMTGCLLSVTVVSGAPTQCEDIYFNAS